MDGVYLNESISSYSDIINELNAGSGIKTYTAVDAIRCRALWMPPVFSFDSLAQMNPQLLSLDQEVDAGTELITGAASAELLKVKVVRRETETVAIPFETQNSDSSEYDFGKVVTLQDGEDGSEDVTYEVTMIDGVVTDRQAISYTVTKAAVPEITVTGTRLKSGMVAPDRFGQLYLAGAQLHLREPLDEQRTPWRGYLCRLRNHNYCVGFRHGRGGRLALFLRQLRGN